MKKYPKALADVTVLRDTLEYIYRQVETAEEEVEVYKEQIKEVPKGETPDSWIMENIAEHEAKAAAYVRLAEKLAK